jgi:hypothetical protein
LKSFLIVDKSKTNTAAINMIKELVNFKKSKTSISMTVDYQLTRRNRT